MFVAVFFCFLAKLDTTWQHGTTFFLNVEVGLILAMTSFGSCAA